MLYNLYGGIMIMIEKYKNLIDKDSIKITTEEGSFTISFEGKSGLYWRYTPPKEICMNFILQRRITFCII